jgi:hypothetical protein
MPANAGDDDRERARLLTPSCPRMRASSTRRHRGRWRHREYWVPAFAGTTTVKAFLPVMPAQAGIQYSQAVRRRRGAAIDAGVYWITRLRG